MASGDFVHRQNMKMIVITKTVALTVNKVNSNQIDLSSDIELNKPGSYKFDHMEFLGAWPKSSWTNAIVSRASGWSQTTLYLQTASTQNFDICVMVWYRRI